MPEFESGGWWQRSHKRVRCRQCKCSLVENPSFKSSKCHKCGKQMKTKGKRLEGVAFTNADPRYAGKLDDPQGDDATMLMQVIDFEKNMKSINSTLYNVILKGEKWTYNMPPCSIGAPLLLCCFCRHQDLVLVENTRRRCQNFRFCDSLNPIICTAAGHASL